MARPSPQSFEKRQREIRKRMKRAEKLERRLIRNDEKRRAKDAETWPDDDPAAGSEDGSSTEDDRHPPPEAPPPTSP